MIIEIVKFIIYSALIVIIAKYALVTILRKLAESMNLSAKVVGNIAGIATSVPELLTVCFSAVAGLIGTSIYNILSSNIINLVQYIISVFTSKNQKILNNRAIRIDLLLVVLTIIIPVFILAIDIEIKLEILPIFFLLFLLFYFINNNTHKLYLSKQTKEMEKETTEEAKWVRGKIKVTIKYLFLLVIASVSLYIVGNALSISLENLAEVFYIPEIVLGVLLGFITSIPELITFFESQKHYKNKKNEELGVIEATNNLLTSNILNLFIIQSIGILIFSFIT
ncbi:MAG: hypothetical protein J6A29_01040 [Clostridia bacterium]|nr:hypothetical protein [Clostridia bacterium]